MCLASPGRRGEPRRPGRNAPRTWLRAVALLQAVWATGCAGALGDLGGPIRTQVVEAGTGRPIAGAVVLGVWTKRVGLPGLYHTELVDVKETETDAEGWFVLERPAALGIEEEAVTVYKFGYVAWSNLFVFPTSKRREDVRVPARIGLEPFPAGGDRRRHIDFINDARRSVMYRPGDVPRFWQAIERERQTR